MRPDRSPSALAWPPGAIGNCFGKTASQSSSGGNGATGQDTETWLVGLELDIPGNFWGIDYAPSDWKIEDGPSHSTVRPGDQEPIPAAKPDHSRRLRLTDINHGSCYLETAVPFRSNTPVLLSIRLLGEEWVVDGVVRVSHAQTGMGVEFTQAEGRPQRVPVEELIERLARNGETPRIFVGRKEGQLAASNYAPRALHDSGVPVPF